MLEAQLRQRGEEGGPVHVASPAGGPEVMPHDTGQPSPT
jgi:hypothetical protein